MAQATEHAETIAAIRARADHQLSRSQRAVEALTANIGRPSIDDGANDELVRSRDSEPV